MQNSDIIKLRLKGHTKRITSVQFRNDDQLLSGSEDTNIVLWNLNTSDVKNYQFSWHQQAVNDITCSINGKLIASASSDKTVCLWVPSLNNGSTEIKAHLAPIKTVHFSHSGRKLLTGADDKCLKVWDVPTRTFLHSFVGHNHFVNCGRLTTDAKLVVSSAQDKTVKVWDVNTRQCIHTFTNSKASATKVAVFQNYVACAYQSGSVRIYDLLQLRQVQHYLLHDSVACVDWHPSGKFLLAGKTDGSVDVIDILEGRPVYNLIESDGAITGVAFSPSSDKFVSSNSNGEILVWNWNAITMTTTD